MKNNEKSSNGCFFAAFGSTISPFDGGKNAEIQKLTNFDEFIGFTDGIFRPLIGSGTHFYWFLALKGSIWLKIRLLLFANLHQSFHFAQTLAKVTRSEWSKIESSQYFTELSRCFIAKKANNSASRNIFYYFNLLFQRNLVMNL